MHSCAELAVVLDETVEIILLHPVASSTQVERVQRVPGNPSYVRHRQMCNCFKDERPALSLTALSVGVAGLYVQRNNGQPSGGKYLIKWKLKTTGSVSPTPTYRHAYWATRHEVPMRQSNTLWQTGRTRRIQQTSSNVVTFFLRSQSLPFELLTIRVQDVFSITG